MIKVLFVCTAIFKVWRESLDFVGFLRWRQTIYTLFIPLEDRIGN